LTTLVLDCSLTMAWCFEDEGGAYADAVLERLNETAAVVPSIWPLEVGNVLLVAERRRRLTQADSARFLSLLRALPISVDDPPTPATLDGILSVARQEQLSAYDAAYVELALRQGAEFATLDERLRTAARALGIGIVGS
jgi:predicted nucleic acid-binding protein